MPNDNDSNATKFVREGDVEKHAATPPPPAVSQTKPAEDAQPSEQTHQTNEGSSAVAQDNPSTPAAGESKPAK